MKDLERHLEDQQLLRDVDGELPRNEAKRVRIHLEACWQCRSRRRELEDAISGFVRAHQAGSDADLPADSGLRALLKARLSQAGATPDRGSTWFAVHRKRYWLVPGTCVVLALGLFLGGPGFGRLMMSRRSPPIAVFIPNPRLTPGAAIRMDRESVCAQENVKNKAVSRALQRQVFQEYGISGQESQAYEVDYLITPALGGADDIHNLWPHSLRETAWSADVKDALEDRFREMVCDGRLDLATAQREISDDWIGAYRKYFQTNKPLPEHFRHASQ